MTGPARWATPAVVFVGALAARLWGLGSKPFWLDELTTSQRASLPLPALVHDSLRYHHLPAYFALVSPLSGAADFGWRVPSALLGALACALTAAAAIRLGGRHAGLLAGTLVALSPLQVQYGQEARSYALLLTCIATSLLGFARLAQDATLSDRKGWTLALAGTFGATNTLSVGLFWPFAASLGLLAATRRLRAWRIWTIGLVAVAAATLPWFAAMYRLNFGAMTDGLDWVPSLSLEEVKASIASVYLFQVVSLVSFRVFPAPVPGLATTLGGLVLAAMLGGAVWTRRREPEAGRMLAGMAIAFPAALLAVSVVRPLFIPRYLLWGALPAFILAGLGVNLLPVRARLPAVGAVALLLAVNLAGYYRAETKPRWDLASRMLGDRSGPSDVVLAPDTRIADVMEHFLARDGAAWDRSRFLTDPATAAARLATGSTVWLPKGAIGQTGVAPALTPEDSERFGHPGFSAQFGNDVALFRFAR